MSLLLRSFQPRMAITSNSRTITTTPIAIPALAPVERPLEEAFEEGADAWLGLGLVGCGPVPKFVLEQDAALEVDAPDVNDPEVDAPEADALEVPVV
jgi:hypothetical protein